jgi:hypothetical protein
MDTILIGIAVLLVVIVAFVYLKLSRQMNSEISKLNKKIESLSPKNIEQTNTPPLSTSTNNVVDSQQPIIFSKNTETSTKYNNIKEQYDTYVQNNNFDNIYEEDLSENIRNEIDNFTNNELSEEIPTGEIAESLELSVDEPVLDDLSALFTTTTVLSEPRKIVDELVDEGDELVDEGDELVDEGDELVDEGDELVDEGDELVDDGNELVDDGDELVDDGNELVDDGNELVDNKVNYKDYTIDEINNLTVKELQEIARKNKLKIRGKKDDLIERIKSLYNLNIIMN